MSLKDIGNWMERNNFGTKLQGMGEHFAGRGSQWRAAQAREAEAEAYRRAQEEKARQAKIAGIQSESTQMADYTFRQIQRQMAAGQPVDQETLKMHLRGMAGMGANRAALNDLTKSMLNPETQDQTLRAYVQDVAPMFGGGEQPGRVMSGADVSAQFGVEVDPNSLYNFDPSKQKLSRVGGGETNIDVNTGGNSPDLGSILAENYATNFENAFQEARDAQGRLRALSPLRSMNPEQLGTGWGRTAKASFANAVGSVFGEGAGNAIDPDAAEVEVFRAASQALVNEDLRLNNGVQTEGDAQRARDTFPSVGKLPEANKFLISYMTGIEERKIQRAQFYEDGIQAGKSAKQIQDEWSAWMNETPLISEAVEVNGQTFAIRYPNTRIPMVYTDFEKAFMQREADALKGMPESERKEAARRAWREGMQRLRAMAGQ